MSGEQGRPRKPAWGKILAGAVVVGALAAALRDPSRLNYWILGAVILAFAALTWFASRWVARQSLVQG